MSEVLQAIGIAAGILFPVVILIVIVSMIAVNRGEVAQNGPSSSGHGAPDIAHRSEAAAAAPLSAKPTKAAAQAAQEVPVGQILIFGLGLFAAAMLLLFAVSFIEHSI